jgi:hypothetical protein
VTITSAVAAGVAGVGDPVLGPTISMEAIAGGQPQLSAAILEVPAWPVINR